MLRLNRFLIIVLVIMMSFSMLLTGCSPKEENTAGEPDTGENIVSAPEADDPSNSTEEPTTDPTQPEEASHRKKVFAPVEISYVIPNPIDITYEDVNNAGKSSERRFKIVGLKNKEVEEGINQVIVDIFEGFKSNDLPPYRGIKAVIPDSSMVIHSNIDGHIPFNYNNVISVCIYSHTAYASPTKRGGTPLSNNPQYVNQIEGVTLDLNTGEKLKLKDIFADNVDYISILNDHITKAINQSNATDEGYFITQYPDFKLVAPFKGITEDQKFYLNNSGLTLVFDYRNPEFDNRFNATTIYIDFYEIKENLAITERFYNEGVNLFEKDQNNKEFLQGGPRDFFNESKFEVFGNLELHSFMSYPNTLPENILEIIMELPSSYQGYIDELSKSEEKVFADQYISVHQVAKYTNISTGFTSYQDDQYWGESQMYCYDEDFNLLKIEDLFIEDFDYEGFIKERIQKELINFNISNDISIDELYKGLQFKIEPSALVFITESFDWGQQRGRQPIHVFIPFTDLDADDLRIFE
ncbi:RsiV family protein [Alkaliphilus serpentinus]|uniref:DUF3298 domain-containing protein n=1 Tax=Alkaliphilus serpentinus TaxID=1482731 RepID=A0A833HP60_9FIRM|nr:RsiV family protein [Alkaliphilus serpentinus]KAB3530324.1 DUF3298 domain-containing protein [Alkaliphilus serpentinus]